MSSEIEINEENVYALYKTRTTGTVFKIRLIKDDGWHIYGTTPSENPAVIDERFGRYSKAIDRWNELLARAEPPF